MTKISIITTSYNHKDFIGYTIQSILDQTFSDRELLIGDDSPGNETWETIE
jgi:glycosyltransferase involved in cell wall biosynthesis